MSASESRPIVEDCVFSSTPTHTSSTSPSVSPLSKRRVLDTKYSNSSSSSSSARISSLNSNTAKSTPKKRARMSSSGRTGPVAGTRTAAPDRFIPSRGAMDLDLSRMALFSKQCDNASNVPNPVAATADAASNFNTTSSSDPSANAAAAGRFVGELGYESCLQSTMLRSSSISHLSTIYPVSSENRPPTDVSKVLKFAATSSKHDTNLPASNSFLARTPLLHNSNMRGVPRSRYHSAGDNSMAHPNAATGGRRRRQAARYIAPQPYKILDAPNIQEDFYFNLLDWGATGSLAVALHDTVYLWDSQTGAINRLLELNDPSIGGSGARDDFVTSVSWSGDGRYLAVGTNRAAVQVWDVMAETRLRSWTSHAERVSALAWKDYTLTSGGRDSRIIHNDVRTAGRVPYAVSAAHTQEVCGLKWSPNGQQLASGGNDNLVHTWDATRVTTPRLRLDLHRAAVKAIAWCPHQANILATGGGTADRMLRFWNTCGNTGVCTKAVDTKSQVSGIAWSGTDMECVTSHGFSQNQLTVWKYSSLTKLAELKGHTQRVLHLALSPDGTTVVSGAADESLRFWKVFESNGARRAARAAQAQKSSVLSHHRVVWR